MHEANIDEFERKEHRGTATAGTGRQSAKFLSRTLGDIGRLEGSPPYSLYFLDTDRKLLDPSNSMEQHHTQG